MLKSIFRSIKNSPVTPRLLTYGFGFGVGFGTGAFITQRKLEAKFEEILEKEVQDTKNYYRTLYKVDISSPTEHPNLKEATKSQQKKYEDIVEDEYDSNEEVEDTQKQPDPSWTRDVAPELQDREVVMTIQNPSSEIPPYLVEEEEYHENEPAFDQIEVVYYMGDRVLVEAPDDPWENPAEYLGEDYNDILGVLDREATEIFVRNNDRAEFYHIELDTETYADKFAGENELKHAHRRERRRQPKFRGDYE